MKEDSALTLKKKYDKEEAITLEEAHKMLGESEVMSKLLSQPERPPTTFVGMRNYMWRLLELSEIPYANTLDTVQKWIELLVEKSTGTNG